MLTVIRRRIVEPVLSLLAQGLAPRELALCMALGAGIGLFPVWSVAVPILWARANAARGGAPKSSPPPPLP